MSKWPTTTHKSSIIGIMAIVFFLFLPLEGVLRKWVFSDYQQIFGLIRDPILIIIYWIYFFSRGRRNTSTWVNMFILFAGLFIAYVYINGVYNDASFVEMLLGVRSYVMYVPLGFILAETLTNPDIRKIIKVSLYVSIPIAILVIYQFFSPIGSPINKGLSDDIEGLFTVVFGVIRPYGPFTFAQAQSHFAALMVSMALIAWEKRRQYEINFLLIAAAGFSALVMGALSGARTFFGLAILICVAYVLAIFTAQKVRHGASRIMVLGSIFAAFFIIFTVLFPTSFDAMSARQSEAEYIEGSTVMRAIRGFDISEEMNSAPLFGYGAGAGSNAALVLSQHGVFTYGETEWGRMINELGPLMGVLVIAFRFAMTVWLGLRCIRINRKTGDSSALIIFGFSGYMLLYAQTTGQNQNLSFCWFAVGLTLSLCRLAQVSEARSHESPSEDFVSRIGTSRARY